MKPKKSLCPVAPFSSPAGIRLAFSIMSDVQMGIFIKLWRESGGAELFDSNAPRPGHPCTSHGWLRTKGGNPFGVEGQGMPGNRCFLIITGSSQQIVEKINQRQLAELIEALLWHGEPGAHTLLRRINRRFRAIPEVTPSTLHLRSRKRAA